MMSSTSLGLSGLGVRVSDGPPIIEGVDLSLMAGEILGLVGESGSGKTTTALALLGYTMPGIEVVNGELTIKGRSLQMDESMRASRGRSISYVPQDPGRALNPALPIGQAIAEVVRANQPGRNAQSAVTAILETVGLTADEDFRRRYPHQLSGGQQQRVCIAMATVCEPSVIVLDEPTTGLDVVTQARILDALRRLCQEKRISMVYVTHDLAVVSEIADRIAVMYAGRIVEHGMTAEVLRKPAHPYTRGLLSSTPDHVSPYQLEPMPGISLGLEDRSNGCAFAPRCEMATPACVEEVPSMEQVRDGHEVRCIHWTKTGPLRRTPLVLTTPAGPADSVLEVVGLTAEYGSGRSTVVAAQDVNFSIGRGECVALVGESGSGKTTIARTIAGLHEHASGRVLMHGQNLPGLIRHRTAEQRRQIQLIFQNPAAALNPRQTVAEQIGRPAVVLRGIKGSALSAEVAELLDSVRLSARLSGRLPHQLSGGERQRVAIARALAAGPEVLLCDEVTSALDVSVQAAVLELLGELRTKLGLGLLFITHDLGVTASLADRILIFDSGSVVESGPAETVLQHPQHPYTKSLLAASPSISRI